MTNKNLIIVEFSVKQNAFHKHTMQSMIFTNIKSIFQGIELDYLPIGVFETEQEADEFITTVYNKFKKISY